MATAFIPQNHPNPEMSSQDFTNSKSDSKIGDDLGIFSKINRFMLQMVRSRACCLVTLLSFISFHLLEAASFFKTGKVEVPWWDG